MVAEEAEHRGHLDFFASGQADAHPGVQRRVRVLKVQTGPGSLDDAVAGLVEEVELVWPAVFLHVALAKESLIIQTD